MITSELACPLILGSFHAYCLILMAVRRGEPYQVREPSERILATYVGLRCQIQNPVETRNLKRESPSHITEQSLIPTESIITYSNHFAIISHQQEAPNGRTIHIYLACRKVVRKPLKKGVLPHTLGKTHPPMFKTPPPVSTLSYLPIPWCCFQLYKLKLMIFVIPNEF